MVWLSLPGKPMITSFFQGTDDHVTETKRVYWTIQWKVLWFCKSRWLYFPEMWQVRGCYAISHVNTNNIIRGKNGIENPCQSDFSRLTTTGQLWFWSRSWCQTCKHGPDHWKLKTLSQKSWKKKVGPGTLRWFTWIMAHRKIRAIENK